MQLRKFIGGRESKKFAERKGAVSVSREILNSLLIRDSLMGLRTKKCTF